MVFGISNYVSFTLVIVIVGGDRYLVADRPTQVNDANRP